MKRSAGVTDEDPGKVVLDWNAESRVQPCWVKRLRMLVCV